MNATLKFLAAGLVGLMAASVGQAGHHMQIHRGNVRFNISTNRSLVVRPNVRIGAKKLWFGRFSCRRWYPGLRCYIYWNPACSCWYYCSPGAVQYVQVPADVTVAPPADDDDE
jgi:hypothetical protein